MLLSEVIREISDDLNDQVPGHEYLRWPVEQLQAYVWEAMSTVGQARKDLFTASSVVKVNPGTGWQSIYDNRIYIQRIVGESDAAGNVTRSLSRIRDIDDNTWGGPTPIGCTPRPKDYTMSSYQLSIINYNAFRVIPPVPPGVDKYVLVQYYTRPIGLNLDGDVPDEVVVLVKQWALYRALAVDSENNPTITQLAQLHYKVYTDLLQLLVAESEKRHADNFRAPQKPSTP